MAVQKRHSDGYLNLSFDKKYRGARKFGWGGQSKEALNSSFSDAKSSASSIGAMASGVTGIMDTAIGLSEIADTTAQEKQIDNLSTQTFESNSTDSLLNQWNDINWAKTDYNWQDVRGSSGGEQAMGVVSATASGAMTGLQVGGPWGAAIGATIGTASGLAGMFAGNKKAKNKAKELNNAGVAANMTAEDSYTEAVNDLNEQTSRNNMKSLYGNVAADGGEIHINPANKGKFTEAAKRAGMGTQEYARHILANKDDYNTTMIRRANFARNAAGWKHPDGGYLYDYGFDYPSQYGTLPIDNEDMIYDYDYVEGAEYDLDDNEINSLLNQGYEIEYI